MSKDKTIEVFEALAGALQTQGEMLMKYATAATQYQTGVQDALIYLATAVAQQKGINAKQLAEDFSKMVELNHPADEDIPMTILNIRAALYQVVQS